MEWWTEFLRIFCEVQSVCTYGRPNWLGWFVLYLVPGFVMAPFMYLNDYDDNLAGPYLFYLTAWPVRLIVKAMA